MTPTLIVSAKGITARIPGDAHLVDRFEDDGVYFTARTPLQIVSFVERRPPLNIEPGRYERIRHGWFRTVCACGSTQDDEWGERGSVIAPTLLRRAGWTMSGRSNKAKWHCPACSQFNSASPSGGSAAVSEIPLADSRVPSPHSQAGDDALNNNRDVNRFHNGERNG